MNWKKIDSDIVGIVPELMKFVTSSIPLLISLAGILILPVFVAFRMFIFITEGAYSWTELIKNILILIALFYIERGLFKYLEILNQKEKLRA